MRTTVRLAGSAIRFMDAFSTIIASFLALLSAAAAPDGATSDSTAGSEEPRGVESSAERR